MRIKNFLAIIMALSVLAMALGFLSQWLFGAGAAFTGYCMLTFIVCALLNMVRLAFKINPF